MMAAALVLCLMSFFIVAGSVAYASILVSTCAACVGVVLARLLHVLRVNSGVMMAVEGWLHSPTLLLCFGCHFFAGSLASAH